MSVRIYRSTGTLAHSLYDETSKKATNIEVHAKASLSGPIGPNRLKLAKAVTSLLQGLVRRRYDRRVSPDRIKVRFEKEEPGKKTSSLAEVRPVEYVYRGKSQRARLLPLMTMKLAKQKPRRRRRRKQLLKRKSGRRLAKPRRGSKRSRR